MITRSILEAERKRYMEGRQAALANLNAFNGAIETIDDLLKLCAQEEEARAASNDAKEGDPNA